MAEIVVLLGHQTASVHH